MQVTIHLLRKQRGTVKVITPTWLKRVLYYRRLGFGSQYGDQLH